ncbi:MAG: hypothetical protein VKQ33_04820 [Candidatus Sericytochromatia bacterium]|nr:hypothetical protein [Candidatus Sericytochromatia bacterium]
MSRAFSLALPLLACVGLVACAPLRATTAAGPGGPSGALPLDVLAVTTVDAETQNPRYRIHVRWPAAPNARIYEVIRRFEGGQASVKATLQAPGWVDDALGAGQGAAYKVNALAGDSKVLTVTDEKAITVLREEVPAPTGLVPVDGAVLGVDEVPTLSWDRVEGAAWYHVRVWRASDDQVIYAALTSSTSVKLGDRSPLLLEKFPDVLPVEGEGSLQRGVVHRWTVSAVRTTGGQDPARVTAIDHRPSKVHRFSPGG